MPKSAPVLNVSVECDCCVFQVGNLCAVCGTAANQWCSRCRLVMYCGRQWSVVRGTILHMRIDHFVVCSQRRHWKAGHKQECAAATQGQPVAVTDTSELRESECPVCLDEFEQPVKLPCSHVMCCGCLKQLRESNVGTACPMCRAKLPPGPEVLFADGYTMHLRAERAAEGPVKQRLQQRAAELFQPSAAQGYAAAQCNLAQQWQQWQRRRAKRATCSRAVPGISSPRLC